MSANLFKCLLIIRNSQYLFLLLLLVFFNESREGLQNYYLQILHGILEVWLWGIGMLIFTKGDSISKSIERILSWVVVGWRC